MVDTDISVTAEVADCRPARLRLRLAEQHSCGGCSQRSVCSNGSDRLLELTAIEPAAPQISDSVDVSVSAAMLTRLALLGYLLPALFMLAGAALAGQLGSQGADLWELCGAVAGLLLGCVSLRLYDSRSGGARWVAESTPAGLRIRFSR